MANQSPDRREVLAMLARVAVVAEFQGFSRWVCAAEVDHAHASSARPATYEPQFFSADEFKTLDDVCDRIIPKDDSPGAHEAGVAEFIDFLVAHDTDLQYAFRSGLAWLNAFAVENSGSAFLSFTTHQQDALLRKLAYRSEMSPTQLEGQEFFAMVRRYTVIGYYTSRIGLESLDYPGLRLYSRSPECPHQDDPEHKHLPPPRY